MAQLNLISEKEAAQMIGYKPRTLREKVKNGTWDIKWSAVEGRRYRYCKKDIEKLQLVHSNISSFT